MNPIFGRMMGGMNQPVSNVMNMIQQIRQMQQNPNQLASFLQQRGMINENQARDIQSMGSNYQQIGRYLMNNGKLPNDVQSYQSQVEQVQNIIDQE